MSRFKVGDEVRVKAGSPTAFDGDGVAPYQRSFGEKLKIKGDVNGGRKRVDGLTYWHVVFGEDGGQDVITENYLEPWNPAEEWDGVKWVPKKPYRGILAAEDHIVILRENGVLKPNSPPHVHPSFDDASKEAKRLAEKHNGQEFCVFGMKAVERREKSKAETVKDWLLECTQHQIVKGDDSNFKDEEGRDVFDADITNVQVDSGNQVTVTYKLL